MNDKQLAVLLTCFSGTKTAGAARPALDSALSRQGDVLLQTTVLQVDAKHRTSVHDVQRAVRGTLTAALTWGAFGLVAGTNRIESALIWAVLGALCGGVYAYTAEHLLTKDQLARLGQRLPASSSALLTFARSDNAKAMLEASRTVSPSAASAASISPTLEASVYAGDSTPVELRQKPTGEPSPTNDAMLSMIVVRYPDITTAHKVAAAAVTDTTHGGDTLIELVIETRSDGRRKVSDPAQGVAAMSRSDVVSWGGFGLVFGAIMGVVGGGGILGFLKDGLVTGIGWAVFGLVAGALYGLWAGRSTSARRLKAIGEVLPHGTSALVAWAEGALFPQTLEPLDGPGARRLVLSFNQADQGAVLEAL